MLDCHNPESHLSSQSRRSTEVSINSTSSFSDFNTPSLELHDTRDLSPSEPSPTSFDTAHMQSALISRPRSKDYLSAKTHPYLASQDSGLGIRTAENSYLSHYDPFDPDLVDFSHFDDGQNTIRNGRRGDLASPFEEHFFAPGPGWSLSDNQTLFSNVARTPYSSTADRYMHQNSLGYGSSQYMTPQATVNNTPSQYMPIPNGQFKRPLVRHNSTAGIIPQTTLGMDFPGTTSTEVSPGQWAPLYETPLWHDVGPHHEDSSHMPPNIFDYVSYGNIDNNLHVDQDESNASSGSIRKKPHLRSSLSESSVTRSLSPGRMRAISMIQPPRPSTSIEPQYMTGMVASQLPLPPLPSSMLMNTPRMQLQTPMFSSAQSPMYRKPRSMSNTPQRLRRPSSPPPSDLNNTDTPFLTPVRQDPTFPGDLYTPRYKRRTSAGRWEGWCGYCHPGRWLDLKNSRFWEDKLRNHGICAKTKLKFAEPERIRWVNMDGKVCQTAGAGSGLEVGDQGTDQKKREGLCGVCATWVPMDGMRTKAKDRAVGWWMHAYKCHDHEQGVEQSAAS